MTVLLVLLLVSCDNESPEQSATADSDDIEAAEIQAEIQSMTEVLDEMSEMIGIEMDAFDAFKENSEKTLPDGTYFSSCLSRTLVIEDNGINLSLDFGNGCEGPHGNVLAGIIRVDIQLISLDEQIITHSFQDFSINGRAVEGTMTKNRVRSNAEGYPEVQTSRDLGIQWDEDTAFSRVGETTRIWVSGSDTRNWGDDVFLTTGGWNVFKNGVLQRSVTISKELRRELSCRFLVSGTLEIQGVTDFSLDFGDGSCDDKAIVEIGDRQEEIQLGRLRKLIRK
jgi:hypothetical protein